MRPILWSAIALASLAFVACASTPEPPPPAPAKAPPPPPPPPPEPPPPPRLAVAPLRAVATGRVPKVLTDDLARKLEDQLYAPGVAPLTNTSTLVDAPPCVLESCQLSAARSMAAATLLHTRLVQYAEHCVIVSVLYDTPTSQSIWAFSRSMPCEAAPLEEGIAALTTAYKERPPAPAAGPIHAVLPVQHDLEDVAFASESYAELLTTLLAEAGRTLVPASAVSVPLEGGKAEPRKACGDKKCAYELGTNVGANKSVATKIVKKGKSCTLTAAVHDIATKSSTVTATAKVGCDAHLLAEGLRDVSAQLLLR